MPRSMFPALVFDEMTPGDANERLIAWGHRMGPLCRGKQAGTHYALFFRDEPVALASASTLIADHVGGGLTHLTRDNTIELSRLCAARPGLCRVALRLWREFVFPMLDGGRYQYAVSYQDADLHNGDTYRFDGWTRAGYSASGTDTRSGRPGRRKYIWVWERRDVQ